jgi:hypothetical protein
LLTAYEIKDGFGKRQGEGITFPPLDYCPWCWREGARDGQPPSVEIETDHVACSPNV